MKTLILSIVLSFFSSHTFAGDITIVTKKAVSVGAFKVGIGSLLEFKTDEKKLNGEQVFLGNVLRADGSEMYKMLLSSTEKKVYYVDSQYFSRKNKDQQTLIDPYIQVGSTCTGYAINGFLNQTNLAQFEGNGVLKKELQTEEGRSQLLAHAISEYYLTSSHKYSIRAILNSYGKTYGFKCGLLKTENFSEAKSFILSQLASGLPVIVSFNIGPVMHPSTFPLEMYEKNDVKIDDRLWLPRRVGERNSGGHTIVAAGSFEVEGKTYLTMLDSDWNEPRVWDMELSLNHAKTALNEVEFISCK